MQHKLVSTCTNIAISYDLPISNKVLDISQERSTVFHVGHKVKIYRLESYLIKVFDNGLFLL